MPVVKDQVEIGNIQCEIKKYFVCTHNNHGIGT